ncbi:MAG TPA: hypothetical protein EYP10_04530, partial [Armatimonadetes bacterium]|nr:hypothetical protein [Armatimonadota bacterium]
MLFVSKFTAGLRIITLCAFTLIASGLQFDECYARGGQLRYERHRSIAYEFRKVTGIAVHVITINMNDPEVKVSIALAAGGIGTAEPFISMVERMHPVMAVTGTYFDLRTRIPVGTIVIDGRPVHISPIGTALAITPDNRVQMIDVRLGKPRDWSGYETVLLCGPRLLRNAQIKLYPRAQGFRAPNLFTYRRRIAVGWRPNNKLVIVATKR